MKWVLFTVLLLSTSFAGFKITAMDVIINVNEDGSADVTENLHLIVTTDYHISLYENGLAQSDLASWSSLTGLNEVRYHMDNRNVDVQEVVVRPQPVSKCNPLADLCHGELRITYHVDAYRNREGEPVNATGLFIADGYKPRTTRFTLNSAALGFEQSELGDVILGENQRLTFVLPGRVSILEVSPLPEDMDAASLDVVRELSWENTVLAHFRISFETEDSLDTEVLEFFMDARGWVTGLVSGPEGPALIVLAVIIVGGYLHLQTKVKKVAK